MIGGIFHQGSGLGNQLHRYIMTRVLAEDYGYEWGMLVNNNDSSKQANFKGDSFMKGNFYGSNLVAKGWPKGFTNFIEKKVIENGVDIRGFDPEVFFIGDNTLIDGEFQDERYFSHRLKDINRWLKVAALEIPDDTCVIGFRGGEFTVFPDLFLTKDYWDKAIDLIKAQGISKFEVHTDDPVTAQQFFPDFPIIHDVGINWRSMRYAKHAIIANSSFYILPRLLRGGMTIAPRYWARRNTKVWALPQNFYKSFIYV